MEVVCGGSKRLSELFLLKSILLEKSGNNSHLTTLVKSVHAIMLESGFVLLDHSGFDSCSDKLLLVSLRYTLPQLITLNKDTVKIESVTVNFRKLNCTVVVYGTVDGSSSMLKVVIDKCRLVPAINLVWRTNLKFDKEDDLRMVKDGIVIPLLFDLYDKAGLEHPACLLSLPTELKLEILELLPGTTVAKMACICTEMRYLASHNDLWKNKCLEEAKNHFVVDQSGSDSVDWKAKFKGFWKRRDVIKILESIHSLRSSPTSL